MSLETVKKNLYRILDERNMSVPELEKKAGTNRNVYDMLKGKK